MKKRILSLLCVLALCLGLLPVTALAAGEGEPDKLYVGDQNVRSEENTTYWVTTDSGGLTRVENATDNSDDWTVRYNPNDVTLTLKNATIKTTHNNSQGAVIYAESRSNSAMSLTIRLEGENTIKCDSASYGIYVNAQMSDTSYGTDASLTITGEGSLDVSGSFYGIYVKSGSGDASLTIKEASVNANTTASYGNNHGVYVMSGTYATSSPVLSLAVNGGSLTTSGSASGKGIQFHAGAYEANSATTSLTVTGNAIVDARTGGISASGVNITPKLNIGSTDSTGGIVWNGPEGTVYGNVTLDESLTINQGETLTIPEGSTLNSNSNLTNNGTVTIENGGTLNGSDTINNTGTINVENGGNLGGTPTGGTVVYAPTVTTQPTDQTVPEGETATFAIAATGENLSYQWQQSTGSGNWADIPGATGITYTTEPTTTSMTGYQYRCVVSNNVGSVTSDAATLTHIHTLVKVAAKDATCTEVGNQEYWYCEICKTYFSDEHAETPTTPEQMETPPTGHKYGEPAWNWSADGKTCTVTFTCANDATHTQTPAVTVTSAVKTAATCTEKGVTTYTATAEWNDQTYTDTKDVADIPTIAHSYENGKCTVCGAIAPDFKVVITAGANGTWQKGTKGGLSFTSNAAYQHFQKVQVDGKDLGASNYTVKEGSTIVTLKAEYLGTLAVGKHTLAIVSDTGTATTSFTVKEAATTTTSTNPTTEPTVNEAATTTPSTNPTTANVQSPQTGDDLNIVLLFVVMLASGAALTVTILLKHKRKYSR